jgi:hypothetical protein
MINSSMKDILLNIIQTDTSYNKSATRYLYKTHPELWQQIVEKTSFLPDTALAKQRIWHIVNDTYKIPLCPIENIPVKWWENRYLITSSRTAKQKYKWGKGDYDNIHTPEINETRAKSNRGKRVALGTRKAPIMTDEAKQQREKTKKETFLKIYGVDNPSKSKIVLEKIYQQAVKRGCTPREERSLRRLYYDAVWKVTEASWRNHFDSINPARLNRTYNALDHIYSIQQGFRDSIPPYVIGHYTNLRVISPSENGIKGMRCGKTKQELFEDFYFTAI